jgi:hypothetical protein
MSELTDDDRGMDCRKGEAGGLGMPLLKENFLDSDRYEALIDVE